MLAALAVLIEQLLMAFAEFTNDELLKLNHVHDVEQGLDLIENQNAKLVGDAAVAVLTKNCKQTSQNLTACQRWNKLLQANSFMGSLRDFGFLGTSIDLSLGSYKRPKRREKFAKHAMEKLESAKPGNTEFFNSSSVLV